MYIQIIVLMSVCNTLFVRFSEFIFIIKLIKTNGIYACLCVQN